MTEQLYFDAPLTLEFTAQVTESRPLDGGSFGLILPRTYFYPTSGGQEHDTGFIGGARVVDVYKDNSDIVHVTDQALAPGDYTARIDRERRIRAMQHHTAQHILSASFLEVAGIDSLSANINGETPSTIDLEVGEVTPELLRQVEQFANDILFQNLVIKSYYVTDAEVDGIPFRKPPKVSGRIRVIEVDGFDYTPCGGTHCLQTGMVGLMKIVKTERVNQKLRVHFVAGYQALQFFDQMQAAAQGAALLLDSGLEGVPFGVERLQSQLKQAQHEFDGLRGVVLALEAEKLTAAAEPVENVRLVTALFENRPAVELRSLADKLRREPDLVAVLASFDGSKLSVVAACGQESGLNARDLLQNHLAPFDGHGGGNAGLAQGGGPANRSVLEVLFKQTKNFLAG
jgi:alanyl-tRNA synthetase